MAGEWIKFAIDTPEKPEVFAITTAMGWDDPDLAVGKLLRVWRWFDQQTLDGNAGSVNLALLDRIAGAPGFAAAMCAVGWLAQRDGGVNLPNFARHNGKTAKTRALTASRVASHKSNALANAAANASANAGSVSSALPREEKKRKEKDGFDARAALAALGVPDKVVRDWLTLRKDKRQPLTEIALDAVVREAAKARMTVEAALTFCCVRGWAGFNASWYERECERDPGVAPALKDWE